MKTILVVEDDHTVQKALRHLFENEGYKVEVCGDGQSALNAFRSAPPTAVILDLGLPMLSGKDVCREIRRATISIPIVVVSALADEFDKILLLELGADDYVTKPFSPRELLARVKAAIRRTLADRWPEPDWVEFGSARVDFAKMEASFSGIDCLGCWLQVRTLDRLHDCLHSLHSAFASRTSLQDDHSSPRLLQNPDYSLTANTSSVVAIPLTTI